MTDYFGEKYSPILWDKRIIERRLKKHELASSELQKHLKGLQDDRDQSDELIVHKETAERKE